MTKQEREVRLQLIKIFDDSFRETGSSLADSLVRVASAIPTDMLSREQAMNLVRMRFIDILNEELEKRGG